MKTKKQRALHSVSVFFLIISLSGIMMITTGCQQDDSGVVAENENEVNIENGNSASNHSSPAVNPESITTDNIDAESISSGTINTVTVNAESVTTESIALLNSDGEAIGLLDSDSNGQPRFVLYEKNFGSAEAENKNSISFTFGASGNPGLIMAAGEKSVFVSISDDIDSPRIVFYDVEGEAVALLP